VRADPPVEASEPLFLTFTNLCISRRHRAIAAPLKRQSPDAIGVVARSPSSTVT
jgi:hypothetical protein